MKKIILLLLAIVSVISVSSCKDKYFEQCFKYSNDYELLFLEIVNPSLEIEDVNEFFDYYTTEEIGKKVEEAEIILKKIHEIKVRHKVKNMLVTSDPSIDKLKSLITAKERLKDEDESVKRELYEWNVGV